MKKLSVVLMLIFALLLVGCNSGAVDLPVSEQTEDITTAPKLPIDRKQAIKLASEYWGVKGGEVDEVTGFKMNLFVDESPTEQANRFRIVLRWLVDGHYSVVDEVFVDADTGEVTHLSESEF